MTTSVKAPIPHKQVLITGATGAIGPQVVQAFCDAGFSVRILARTQPFSKLLPDSNTEVRLGDVTDSRSVELAMQSIDVVIHMASLLHIANPSPELCAQYEQTNVYGTANIIEAAIKSNVQQVVFFSTIAVYGTSPPQNVAENIQPQPDTVYGITKLAAERIVLGARRADGSLLGTVLRLAAVYGPRVKGNYARLVHALAQGRFLFIGNGQNRRTLVYDRDVARAAVMAVTQPKAAGQIYNLTDGRSHSTQEIVAAICEALGRKPPRLRIPVGLVRWTAGNLEDGLRLLRRKSPVGRAAVDKFVEEIIVDGSRIQHELGFVPQYDLQAGWREAIREMRQHHLL